MKSKTRIIKRKKTNKNPLKEDFSNSKKIVHPSRSSKIISTETKLRGLQDDVDLNSDKLKEIIKIGDLQEIHTTIDLITEKQYHQLAEHYKKTVLENNGLKIMFSQSADKQQALLWLKRELVSDLNEKYEALKKKISDKRKSGSDVYIAWIISMRIPLKIKMYSTTLEKRDLYKIKQLFGEVEKNL
ncbi:MAG: hypothetical protein AABW89_02460 [Nanoarchaeota archaeon]